MNFQKAIEKLKEFQVDCELCESGDGIPKKAPEVFQTILSGIEQLQVENERFKKERELLAKTADGVPIYVGMEVYFAWDVQVGNTFVEEPRQGGILSICDDWITVWVGGEATDADFDAKQLFSTPELRDAAMKEQPCP